MPKKFCLKFQEVDVSFQVFEMGPWSESGKDKMSPKCRQIKLFTLNKIKCASFERPAMITLFT